MRYVTIAELSDMLRRNFWKIPHDIDLVVGIPRSGLMVANMLALYLNKRLSDLDSFIEGRILPCGDTRISMVSSGEIRRVLVVDDSVHSGNTINKARKKISNLAETYSYFYFSPIVTTGGKQYVDAYAEVIDDERIFEWNLFHHHQINNSCLDMDGVLCKDPIIDDDGEQYKNFILTTPPLFLPTTTIDTIITCRLEKYRSLTEKWLRQHDIQYNHLIMLNLPTKASRLSWGKHGEYKGHFYKSSPNTLFIESSFTQAQKIASISGKPVICIETNNLIPPPTLKPTHGKKTKRWLKNNMPKTYIIFRKIINR